MKEEKKSQSTVAQSSLWNRFLVYMTSPVDPSNLGVIRILFGKIVVVFACVMISGYLISLYGPLKSGHKQYGLAI